MTKHTFSAVALALMLALPALGCGAKTPSDTLPAAASRPAEHEGHAEADEGEHAHGAAGGPIDKFHEQLAPLWHAPQGAQRVTDTCSAAGTLHGLASDIVSAGPPAGAAADYTAAAQKLVDACASLHRECGSPERKDFEARFAAVHEAFHALAERAK